MSHARNRIIYIHGYEPHGQGYTMPAIESLVRSTLPNTCYSSYVEHWSPLMDTRNHTFKEVAEQLAQEIRDGGAYEKQYAVCHSMGGLIARQMCLMPGVKLDGIVTLCSPHEGVADWMEKSIQVGREWFAGRGPLSLLKGHPDLRELNDSAARFRGNNHFVGVKCHGHSGPQFWVLDHDNDTVVEHVSQQGAHVSGNIQRYTMVVDYGSNNVPQGLVGDKLCPHNFVVEQAEYPSQDHISFDNAPLISAIRNCIKL
jgi:pimeloyl-ACP methyl ester carboxylesterase